MKLDAEKQKLFSSIASDNKLVPHTMPGWYYTDAPLFEAEKTAVFERNWVAVGHQSELPKQGNYFTVRIGDEPVIVLRSTDGDIAALSNCCRHRGMQLAEGRGRTSVLTCPYHAWSYDLDGRLIKAPYMENSPAFELESCQLPQFQTTIWQGFIFVNISGDAAPMDDSLAAITPAFDHYRLDQRLSTPTWHETWRTNWKALVENFMEGYHLSTSHATSLDAYSPTHLCEKMTSGPTFTAYRSHYRPEAADRGPFLPELTTEERRSSVLFSAFPNFMIAVGPNAALWLALLPEEPESVAVKMGVAINPGTEDAPATREYIELCHEFSAEDRQILETQQKNMRSRLRPSVPLAPENLEGTIWDFTRFISRSLTSS